MQPAPFRGGGCWRCTPGSRSSRAGPGAIRGMRCSALASPTAPRRFASTGWAPTITGSAPNSNTFTAYIARQVPELGLDLPSNAVGKDFLAGGALFAAAPSGSGFQVSFYGLAGVLLAVDEGFELNLLGLNIGLDAVAPALKLPAIGRLGLHRLPRG